MEVVASLINRFIKIDFVDVFRSNPEPVGPHCRLPASQIASGRRLNPCKFQRIRSRIALGQTAASEVQPYFPRLGGRQRKRHQLAFLQFWLNAISRQLAEAQGRSGLLRWPNLWRRPRERSEPEEAADASGFPTPLSIDTSVSCNR
jgi:hypothetical protein